MTATKTVKANSYYYISHTVTDKNYKALYLNNATITYLTNSKVD
jgi:hypothetical protein